MTTFNLPPEALGRAEPGQVTIIEIPPEVSAAVGAGGAGVPTAPETAAQPAEANTAGGSQQSVGRSPAPAGDQVHGGAGGRIAPPPNAAAPTNNTAQPAPEANPEQQWHAAVAQLERQGLSRSEATRQARQQNPKLHTAYIHAFNLRHSPRYAARQADLAAEATGDADAVAAFNREVAAKVESEGVTRAEATAAVSKEQPELRASMVAAHNARQRQRRR